MQISELIQERDRLRTLWRMETNEEKRAILVLRGRALNRAIEEHEKENEKSGELSDFAEKLFS